MSPQTRTPRQRQGDGLVPLLARVKPSMRRKVREQAQALDVAIADVVRSALDYYFSGRR